MVSLPGQIGKTLRVGGWVKTGREAGAGAFAFLEVNDGSCMQNIQVGGVGGGGSGSGGWLRRGAGHWQSPLCRPLAVLFDCTAMLIALAPHPTQVMVDKEVGEPVGGLKQLTPTSTCVLVEGVLAATPPGTKQKVCACGRSSF